MRYTIVGNSTSILFDIKSADWMHAIEPIGQGIFRPLRLISLQFSES